MKVLNILILMVVLMFSAQSVESAILNGKCIQVEEGDIIKIVVNRKILRIRLESIDCPEKGQAFFDEAREWMNTVALRKKVRVEVMSFEGENIIIGRVFADDKDLQMELVKAGLAWYYKDHGGDRYISKAQKKAKKMKIGIWSQKKPIPPWVYKAEKEEPETNQN